MDKVSLNKLYEYLLDGDNNDTARSFVSMINELPQYLAQKLRDSYSGCCAPFSKVWIYGNTVTVFEQCIIDSIPFTLDVACNPFSYNLKLFIRDNQGASNIKQNNLKDFFQAKGVTVFDDFTIAGDYCLKKENHPLDGIDEFIHQVLEQLTAIQTSK